MVSMLRHARNCCSLWLVAVLIFCRLASAAQPVPERIQFNRDVRPILSDHCYQCHGPDKAKRKADLRLDREESARRVLESGNPAKSDLLERITTVDEKRRMPPVKAGTPLSARDIAVLRRWVEQGAPWQQHWSFLKP